MNSLAIQPADAQDKSILAEIIARAYETVAKEFDLTRDNCPKHPSNCTPEWVEADMNRGVSYFLATSDQKPVGCVALEEPNPNTEHFFYIERLAVLPFYRHKGIGKKLVKFCSQRARKHNKKKVCIGIIDEQVILKEWYKNLGFKMTGKKNFAHLPFTVGFMEMQL